MAIYVDPPFWPAHGTLWSHLVSDTSYDELHRFAGQLGLPRRSFDLDHYDLPASLHDRAVSLGARAVGGRDVVHVLRDSGLRIKHSARDASRPIARLTYLQDEWTRLRATVDQIAPVRGGDEWQRLGSELLVRWNEPHRSYHDARHLEDVLLALDHLRTRGEPVSPTTLLAAWFHDAIYSGKGDDEINSARLASVALTEIGLPGGLVHQVSEMIVATSPGAASHASPLPLTHLLDADLAIFAASPQRYAEYSMAVRHEYTHVTHADFRRGRAEILRTYLAQPTVYRSAPAQAMWEARARTNLTLEIRTLEG